MIKLKELFKKHKILGIEKKNLKCFKKCLINNGIQFIQNITYGVLRTIIGPLLLLLYVNNFHRVSYFLYLILFVTNINLFYFNKNITNLFSELNLKLQRITELSIINTLCLSVMKVNYFYFHKPNTRDNILLKLSIDNQ